MLTARIFFTMKTYFYGNGYAQFEIRFLWLNIYAYSKRTVNAKLDAMEEINTWFFLSAKYTEYK